MPVIDIYICEINGKCGLIDANEKILLHAEYKDIQPPFFAGIFLESGLQYYYLSEEKYCHSSWEYKNNDNIFFIVATESGRFLYNLSKKSSSTIYDDIMVYTESHPQIIFKDGRKYGTLDIEGKVLLKPFYEFNDIFPRGLYYNFQNSKYKVWEEDGLFYGEIPSSEYDICIKVGSHFICKRENKFGLISDKLIHIVEPVLDELILYQDKFSTRLFSTRYYSDNEKNG